MRVLLSCLQGPKRHPVPAYAFWRAYFVEGCREAGIECLEVPGVDWAEGLVDAPEEAREQWRSRTWDAALAYAQREHARRAIDFFLGYLFPAQIEPGAIESLQAMGVPCVNFFCDNVREYARVPEAYAPFALHWVPEFEALPLYRRAGLAYVHAPMPCWVPPQFRTPPAVESEPPTFIGSADVLRHDLLARALRAGGEFVVRGAGWVPGPAGKGAPAASRSLTRGVANQWDTMRAQGVGALVRKIDRRLRPLASPPLPAAHVGPPVSDAAYLRITREAMVTIGVNRVPTARASHRRPLVYSRLRDLEAPMSGACYLTEWTAGLEELYDLGREIETYRSPEELAAKIDELRRDPARRRRLRERGQRRALADHGAARSIERVARRVLGKPAP